MTWHLILYNLVSHVCLKYKQAYIIYIYTKYIFHKVATLDCPVVILSATKRFYFLNYSSDLTIIHCCHVYDSLCLGLHGLL